MESFPSPAPAPFQRSAPTRASQLAALTCMVPLSHPVWAPKVEVTSLGLYWQPELVRKPLFTTLWEEEAEFFAEGQWEIG